MKKYIALLVAMIMCLPMMACGGDAQTGGDDTIQNQEEQTVEQGVVPGGDSAETAGDVQFATPIVADEALVGMWEDSEGNTYELTEDNRMLARDTIWVSDTYCPWTIVGNILHFQNYGEDYKWEIQIVNDEITLKFIDEGLDYALKLVCVDMVKCAAAPEPTEPENTQPETEDPVLMEVRESVYGHWLPSWRYGDGLSDVHIHEDGTCTVDGEVLTWEYVTADYVLAQIYIYRGDQPVYQIYVDDEYEEPWKVASFYTLNEKGESKYVADYYRLDQYTVIELTPENWLEHFELVETVTWPKNDFGDIIQMDVSRYYIVKEEYYNIVNTNLSKAAYEYSYTRVERTLTVDPENRTYTLGRDAREPYPLTADGSMDQHYLFEQEAMAFGFCVDTFHSHDFKEEDITLKEDLQMSRMLGKLYIYKGSN